ncbi:MAG TPA: EcsC family protein [Thermoanaerobaculia bacterium]|nr:EcsC family protein [Thermoanaerobaculia bacterium]
MNVPKMGDSFYRLLETLFKELDQESIEKEVAQLRNDHPGASNTELARVLTKKSARAAAAVGAVAGSAGGPIGLLAMGPDIFNLVRLQSRLVLAIAFLHGRKPHIQERFREVLATLAISTGASASRQGARYLLRRGLEGKAAEKIVRQIAGRFVARRVPAAIPLIGGAAGAGLNYLAVNATAKAAMAYYANEAPDQKTLPPP